MQRIKINGNHNFCADIREDMDLLVLNRCNDLTKDCILFYLYGNAYKISRYEVVLSAFHQILKKHNNIAICLDIPKSVQFKLINQELFNYVFDHVLLMSDCKDMEEEDMNLFQRGIKILNTMPSGYILSDSTVIDENIDHLTEALERLIQ